MKARTSLRIRGVGIAAFAFVFACGGQSLGDGSQDAGGGSTAQGGSAPAGGTASGGTAGAVGTAGASGAGGVCALPFDAGPCDAYVPVFAYSPEDGGCQPRVYGGCGGNANRFDTLEACEAACGGSLHRCPATNPIGQACTNPGDECFYDGAACLCMPTGSAPGCAPVDPACSVMSRPGSGAPRPPGDAEPTLFMRCVCTGEMWACG